MKGEYAMKIYLAIVIFVYYIEAIVFAFAEYGDWILKERQLGAISGSLATLSFVILGMVASILREKRAKAKADDS